MDDSQRVRLLITGYRVSQAVHAAAVLGLSDFLAREPLSVVDLAAAAGCDTRSLHRLLRALTSVEMYQELPDGRFTNTPLSDQLRSDVEGNARGLAASVGRPYTWQAWSALVDNVRTGENAFSSVHGQTNWEFLAQHPEESAIFDAAMTSNSDHAAASILQAYDFGRFDSIVDVAGGRGALLAAILGRHPSLRGVLFDQPHVVSGAAELLQEAGVHDRCRIVGGDMFDEVPAGADAYVMKAILHDWEDPQARAILHTCRRAMTDTATLLVVERLLDAADRIAAFADLTMMVGPGGLERTTAEYADLFTAAGLRLTRTVATTSEWVVIEAVAAG
ncbi:MAG: methyltransferase [Micromonosporaceae bacterium]